jgi:transposase
MVRNKLSRVVVGGVDTHAATHRAAVLDDRRALLGLAQFPATGAGYSDLLRWMNEFGPLRCIGVEGTGAYGAGLVGHLHDHGMVVVEVACFDRRLRRHVGKSDPIDAEAAARTVLAGTASVRPKLSNGPMEAMRALRVVRSGAVKPKTAAVNNLHAMVVTAPECLRAQLPTRSAHALVSACAGLRSHPGHLDDTLQATKAALRSIAHRAQALETEARQLQEQIDRLTKQVGPATSSVFGLGPDTASTLLVTVGDNPDRLRSEAAFARLRGAAPIPASSGKTNLDACTAAATVRRTKPSTFPLSLGCGTTSRLVSTRPGDELRR